MKLRKNTYSVIIQLLIALGFLSMVGCGLGEEVDDIINMTVTVEAGADQTVDLGQTVSLVGTATGGTLFYIWEIAERPTGSFATLSNSTVAETSFVPDVVGLYTLRLTVTNDSGSTESDELTVTVELGNAPEEIGGSIDVNRTLVNRLDDPALADYIVSSLVTVRAQLTIEPGVRIDFADNQGMTIGTGGAIVAIGTAAENIIFTGVEKTNGFWKGLELESNDANNELTYCIIEYGGSSGFDGAGNLSNLIIQESGKIKITNSRFTNSAGYGLFTRTLESDLPDFADNVFTSNKAPIMTRVNHYHYFDAASDYSGNEDDYLDSYWSNVATDQDVTWNALNVPYRMANNIEYIASDVVIMPGANFLGQPNGGIEVTSSGSLSAIGTAENNIVFAGEQDVKGYWKGINIESNNTNNELTYVVISNGGEEGFDGANAKSNIMVNESGRVKITNTTSSMSGGYGLYTRRLESALPGFANNTLTDNVAPVMTRVNHYHYFDTNSDYTGNDDDYIDSYWSNEEVSSDVTWNSLNVPFRIADNVERIASDVTIAAGADFIGQPNGGLLVTVDGSLKAEGTAADKVTFMGEQNVTGYWKGLRFLSNNANNVLTNTVIANGGEEGFDGANRKANVEIGTNALLTLTSCEINLSGGNGIRVQLGGNLTQSDLTFTGNLGDSIFVD